MGKEIIVFRLKKIVWNVINYAVAILIYLGLLIVYLLHKIVPFFPVLLLFDFCFFVGHPLFVRYVLKRKWYDCTKNGGLLLKYILVPSVIMELLVILFYSSQTKLIIDAFMEGNGWK